jgi:hypothetical protein
LTDSSSPQLPSEGQLVVVKRRQGTGVISARAVRVQSACGRVAKGKAAYDCEGGEGFS